MKKNSPLLTSRSQRKDRSQSTVLNEQLTLLYQLEQRKVAKLEEENLALRGRINNLLTKQDDERIELLVADKTKRKLSQLRAITERTIKSLESGLNEFRSFVGDIDETMLHEEANGALEHAKATNSPDPSNNERPLQYYQPNLKRIPESPMIPIPMASSSSRLDIIDENFDQSDIDESVEATKVTSLIHEKSVDMDEKILIDPGIEAESEDKIVKEEKIAEKAQLGVQKYGDEDGGTNEFDLDREEEAINDDDNKLYQSPGIEGTPTHGLEMKENDDFPANLIGTPASSMVTIRRTTLRRPTAQIVKETPEDIQRKNYEQTPKDKDMSQLTQLSFVTTVSQTSQYATPQQSFNSSAATFVSSTGRQKRTAATKVQNYKEPSLSKKMRREY